MVLLVLMLAMAGSAIAREHATLLLTSGERVTGELIDLGGSGFTISVNGTERHIPKGEVAVIDFSGNATNLAAAELAKLSGSGQGVVLSSGEVLQGRLSDIGGSQPLKLTFDLVSGGTRDFHSNEVKRIYLSRPPSAASAANPPATVGPSGSGIPVPANQGWVDTGITVRRGQRVSFTASGEVQLSSDPNDKASPAGSLRGRRPSGPMSQVLAGALIGRIGPAAMFGIGNQTAPLPMPADGRLYLGVNDDGLQDNQGQFMVQVRPGALTNR
jgi:hypothetical protein